MCRAKSDLDKLAAYIRGYAYLVPFVETDKEVFLKTIIPSRKAARKYLIEDDENG